MRITGLGDMLNLKYSEEAMTYRGIVIITSMQKGHLGG